ncbi:ATP-binding cassette domain-containing protein [Pseudonocardia xishanensis]|uniref:Branched-chain amino acid ABC transporter permease/ATP-binding protein n=1 Tax=Pseudonocardia xishanensis TaxID=630995 RepID=A0ABP8RUT6_9PSEU
MQFVILGLVTGAIYALLALGQMVVFRSSAVVNFAQCGFAMVAAYLYLDLSGGGVPPGIAVTAAVLGAGVLAVVVYALTIYPLRRASPLTRAIATLAVLVILQSATSIRYGSNPQIPPAFLPQDILRFGALTIPFASLVILLTCIVLVVVLSVVYRRTRFGRATSGVAENEFAMATLGHSVTRVAALNWFVGGLLSGVAGVLIGPIFSVTPQQATSFLIPALAVALCGRFRSFSVALAGGMFIGVAQAQLTRYANLGPLSGLPGISEAFPFLVIVVVLVLRGDSLPARDFASAVLPKVGTGRLRRGWVAFWVALAVLMVMTLSDEWVSAMTTTAIAAILLLSVVVLTGYAGQLSLAQVGIGGVGVLVSSLLVADAGWPRPLAALAGIAAALPVAALVGLPALRTRGVTLAIVTLGLANALNVMLFTRPDVNVQGSGITVGDAEFLGLPLDDILDPRSYAFFALALLVIVILLVGNLRRSTIGKRLIAVRTNERASAAMGIDVRSAKLYAFVLSGGIATVAGILGAWRLPNVIMNGNFDPFRSVQAVIGSTMGGVGYISGAVFSGAAVQPGALGGTVIEKIGLGQYLALIAGGLLLVNIVLNPDGVVPNTLAALRAGLGRLRATPGEQSRTVRRPRTELALPDSAEPVRPEHGDAVLAVRGLSVEFGATKALADVDLDCRGGEVLGIIGANGSGKTTLVDAITGFVRARGEVTLDGIAMGGLSAYRRSRAGISRSFQSLELLEELTVAENLQAASERAGWARWLTCLVWPGRVSVGPAMAAAISEFGLADDLGSKPSELSYGKRRLLAIARALASSPRVLLLDEPAAGLGEADREEMRVLVRRLAEEWRMAVIIIEHDVDLVMQVSDRVVALEQGHKIADGVPDDVRDHPDVIRSYLGTNEDVTGGAGVVTQPRRAAAAGAPPALRTDAVTSGYAGNPAILDVSIEVRPGEIVALLGPNGAGKTTTLLTICGVVVPSSGSVSLGGGVAEQPMFRRVRDGLALMPEQHAIFREMSVRDNLLLGRGDSERALEIFPELRKKLGVRAGLLSGGEQQMLSLARILASDATVILADELSLGLAPLVVRRLWEALAVAAAGGAAVVVVEQHVRIALEWSDRAYVMRRGRVAIAESSRDLAERFDEVRAAYL